MSSLSLIAAPSVTPYHGDGNQIDQLYGQKRLTWLWLEVKRQNGPPALRVRKICRECQLNTLLQESRYSFASCEACVEEGHAQVALP